jgi:hypothetical protein
MMPAAMTMSSIGVPSRNMPLRATGVKQMMAATMASQGRLSQIISATMPTMPSIEDCTASAMRAIISARTCRVPSSTLTSVVSGIGSGSPISGGTTLWAA